MNISCQIIEDLLPLYAEDMVSEDSKRLIEEHFKECEACKQIYDAMKTPSISSHTEENTTIPIKKIKKKLKKRTILTVCISVFLVVALIWTVAAPMPVNFDYGDSELYTLHERKEAARIVKNKINSFEGCKLYSIHYEGDEASLKELECQSRYHDGIYTDVIVFQSFFRSPIMGGGAWEANQIYSWSWTLGRSGNGNWKLISWGYA